jgi:hypothetical protein
MKAYFFLEVLSDGDQLLHSVNRTNLLKEKVKFFANGEPILTFVSTGAGGEFTINLSAPQFNASSVVEITFSNWRHYAKFPKNACKPGKLVHERESSPGIVMNICTLDRSFSSQRHTLSELPDVAAISNHVKFHICALNLTRYELIVQHDDVPYLLRDPIISHAAESGKLKFLVKGNNPAQLTGTHYKWQYVLMNVNILSHWGENVRILFWDPDEYLIIPNPVTFHDFLQKMTNYYVVNLQRKTVICSTCAGSGPERNFDFASERFIQSDKHLATKVAINPNFAGCVMVHFSLCPDDPKHRIRLDSRIAYLAHFENLHHRRREPTETGYNYYPTLIHNNFAACERKNWTLTLAAEMHSRLVADSTRWGAVASFYLKYEIPTFALLGVSALLACFLLVRQRRGPFVKI